MWRYLDRILVVASITASLTGCLGVEKGVNLQKARRHLKAPVGRSYVTQFLGLENTGGVLSPDKSVLWYPLSNPERGKRLVLRFDGDSLERATVVSAGPSGEFDVEEEVVFDRAQWKPRSEAP